MNPRHWLLRKITREALDDFLRPLATDAYALEIGASYKPRRDLFPVLVAGDLVHQSGLDVQFDTHHLPFADASFPLIAAIEVLEHCHNPQQALDEMYRVLQPGGRLVLTTRFLFPVHDAPHDYFRFTRYGLAHLCRNFDAVNIQAEVTTPATMAVLLQRLAYQCDWKLPLTKIGLLLAAKLIPRNAPLLAAEYGDIRKSQPETGIMSSGYYVIATR